MPYQFSDVLDDELLYERVETFGGGMDEYHRSTLIGPNQSQYLENINVLDNLEATTRPGADTLGGVSLPLGLPVSLIQGLAYFDTLGVQQLIAGAAGKLWSWGGANWIQVPNATLTDSVVRFASAQGIDKLLISDGAAQMHTYDGTTWSAGLGATKGSVVGDPPVGATILCWHTARMFASGVANFRDTIWASFLLAYETSKWDHINFSFRVGGGEGEAIVALASFQNFWLAVLKQNSVYLVNADPTAGNAASWQVLKVASGIGCVGRDAWAANGNDILFMSRDGVRSLRRMQAAAGQYDISPPISEPIQSHIDRINWQYANNIAAVGYKHLVLFAVPLDNSIINNTVLVWNGRLNAWTGIWTGWAPSAWAVTRFNGSLRMVFGDTAGLVRQWKDFQDGTSDATYQDNGAPIPTKLWTRSFLFNEPVNNKDAYHAEARFSVSNALVNFTLWGDGATLNQWSANLVPSGVNLPVNLPFNLANPAAVTARKGLRGLTAFNECYLQIESTAGWWSLRNVSLSAFLNMLANQ